LRLESGERKNLPLLAQKAEEKANKSDFRRNILSFLW